MDDDLPIEVVTAREIRAKIEARWAGADFFTDEWHEGMGWGVDESLAEIDKYIREHGGA